MKFIRIIAIPIRKYFNNTDILLEKFTTHIVI